jgi:probable phosphoglycerate mutase
MSASLSALLYAFWPVFAIFGALLIWLLMRPRRFYFVRHGETILNAQHIRQGAEGGLSEQGKAQAEAAGKYLEQFHISRIIASPYERTRETAAIINQHLKVPVLYSPLVAERRNPKEIIGRWAGDPKVASIVNQMDLAYHDDSYRFSDEENFEDLKLRARKALSLLAIQGARRTCVVTHGIFLKMLIAYLLYRERLHASDYVKLSFFNASDNAAVTICEFNPWRVWNRTRGWKVLAYNEVP